MPTEPFSIVHRYVENPGGSPWYLPALSNAIVDHNPVAIMLTQPVYSGMGYDNFGSTHMSIRSPDGAWTDPQARPIPSMARYRVANGQEEAFIGMLPEYIPEHHQLLAIGTNAWYSQDGRLRNPYEDRQIRYATYDLDQGLDGLWSPIKKLKWDTPAASGMCYASLLQRARFSDGDLLIPVQFSKSGVNPVHLSATTLRCSYDGIDIAIRESGTSLTIPYGRGLFEPSVAHVNEQYYMTLRAEDGHGYVSVSNDGLGWNTPTPWRWDTNHEPLMMGTTQQHWLIHSDAVYLIYTRRSEQNADIFRWRSPLYIAEVDLDHRCLLKNTERTIFPMVSVPGEPMSQWPTFGNFSTCNLTPDLSLIADTAGRCHIAEIRWSQPNTLANT